MQEVRAFYDGYGEKEWARLDADVYARINFFLHMDFIADRLTPGARVLDAGCGAGRFSVEFARLGCAVTLFDLSPVQLAIAKEKLGEYNLLGCARGFVEGDIRDLYAFEDGAFDLVVCYGAPLSYVLEGREQAMRELKRVAGRHAGDRRKQALGRCATGSES